MGYVSLDAITQVVFYRRRLHGHRLPQDLEFGSTALERETQQAARTRKAAKQVSVSPLRPTVVASVYRVNGNKNKSHKIMEQ